MSNSRITKKDFALIKGALRRVFARSELHRRVIAKTIVEVVDSTRPRVKTWCLCPMCETLTPKSYMVVDHISPVIRITSSLEELRLEDNAVQKLTDLIWCEESNLQAICEKSCHKAKSRLENAQRRKNKKELKWKKS